MKGSRDIDLNVQPPPDLAIEVEVSHSAEDAVITWGRLGVAEVWRFDPIVMECSFWSRRVDGTYERIERSLAFPMLSPDDVVAQMRLADELGFGEWHSRLVRWVRRVIVPRKRKGG
jgi:Uma2 family endonuclease